MKGIAINTMTIFIFIIFLGILLPTFNTILLKDFSLFSDPEESQIIVMHNTHSVENALEAAKIYLDSGLRYSVYQSVHDLGKNGGWVTIPPQNMITIGDKNYAIWFDSRDERLPDKEFFLGNLKGSIMDNLNAYARQDYTYLNDFKVILPIYDKVDIEQTQSGFAVNTPLDKPIYIEKKTPSETIRLEKDSGLSQEFDLNYLNLLDRAEEEGRKISADLDELLGNKITTLPTKIPLSGLPDCEGVFINNVGKPTDAVEQEIRDLVSNGFVLESPEEGFITELEFINNDINIQHNIVEAEDPTCEYKYGTNIVLKITVSGPAGNAKFPIYENSGTVLAYAKIVFIVKEISESFGYLDILQTGECRNNNHVGEFNTFRPMIDNAITSSNLVDAIDDGNPLTDDFEKAEALIAGIITRESAWNIEAVSECAAAGIMQLVPGTARNLGLSVFEYPFVDACAACKSETVSKVSACTSCISDIPLSKDDTKAKCEEEQDDRFNPEKSMNAGTTLLVQNIRRCGGVNEGINTYNSGDCDKPAPQGYVEGILNEAVQWEECIRGSNILIAQRQQAYLVPKNI